MENDLNLIHRRNKKHATSPRLDFHSFSLPCAINLVLYFNSKLCSVEKMGRRGGSKGSENASADKSAQAASSSVNNEGKNKVVKTPKKNLSVEKDRMKDKEEANVKAPAATPFKADTDRSAEGAGSSTNNEGKIKTENTLKKNLSKEMERMKVKAEAKGNIAAATPSKARVARSCQATGSSTNNEGKNKPGKTPRKNLSEVMVKMKDKSEAKVNTPAATPSKARAGKGKLKAEGNSDSFTSDNKSVGRLTRNAAAKLAVGLKELEANSKPHAVSECAFVEKEQGDKKQGESFEATADFPKCSSNKKERKDNKMQSVSEVSDNTLKSASTEREQDDKKQEESFEDNAEFPKCASNKDFCDKKPKANSETSANASKCAPAESELGNKDQVVNSETNADFSKFIAVRKELVDNKQKEGSKITDNALKYESEHGASSEDNSEVNSDVLKCASGKTEMGDKKQRANSKISSNALKFAPAERELVNKEQATISETNADLSKFISGKQKLVDNEEDSEIVDNDLKCAFEQETSSVDNSDILKYASNKKEIGYMKQKESPEISATFDCASAKEEYDDRDQGPSSKAFKNVLKCVSRQEELSNKKLEYTSEASVNALKFTSEEKELAEKKQEAKTETPADVPEFTLEEKDLSEEKQKAAETLTDSLNSTPTEKEISNNKSEARSGTPVNEIKFASTEKELSNNKPEGSSETPTDAIKYASTEKELNNNKPEGSSETLADALKYASTEKELSSNKPKDIFETSVDAIKYACTEKELSNNKPEDSSEAPADAIKYASTEKELGDMEQDHRAETSSDALINKKQTESSKDTTDALKATTEKKEENNKKPEAKREAGSSDDLKMKSLVEEDVMEPKKNSSKPEHLTDKAFLVCASPLPANVDKLSPLFEVLQVSKPENILKQKQNLDPIATKVLQVLSLEHEKEVAESNSDVKESSCMLLYSKKTNESEQNFELKGLKTEKDFSPEKVSDAEIYEDEIVPILKCTQDIDENKLNLGFKTFKEQNELSLKDQSKISKLKTDGSESTLILQYSKDTHERKLNLDKETFRVKQELYSESQSENELETDADASSSMSRCSKDEDERKLNLDLKMSMPEKEADMKFEMNKPMSLLQGSESEDSKEKIQNCNLNAFDTTEEYISFENQNQLNEPEAEECYAEVINLRKDVNLCFNFNNLENQKVLVDNKDQHSTGKKRKLTFNIGDGTEKLSFIDNKVYIFTQKSKIICSVQRNQLDFSIKDSNPEADSEAKGQSTNDSSYSKDTEVLKTLGSTIASRTENKDFLPSSEDIQKGSSSKNDLSSTQLTDTCSTSQQRFQEVTNKFLENFTILCNDLECELLRNPIKGNEGTEKD